MSRIICARPGESEDDRNDEQNRGEPTDTHNRRIRAMQETLFVGVRCTAGADMTSKP